MKVGFKTDTGRQRANNEDALLILPKYGVFMVADGVGGQNYGEIASREAVVSIESFIKSNPIKSSDDEDRKYKANRLMSYFSRCYKKVNENIIKLSREGKGREGMATTAVTAYIDQKDLYIANIGDSRAYVIRDNIPSQITEDHTYVNNLINAGTLTKTEAREHPQKNIITKALGTESNIDPDFYRTELMAGDKIMLCTDGLHGELSDKEMADIIAMHENMNDACRSLVEAANTRGGHDNITVICIEI